MYSQNIPLKSINQTAEYFMAENDADHPCISVEQYEIIEKRCSENIKLLKLENIQQLGMAGALSLTWPLKSAAALHDCSYYFISAYVDQNTVTGEIQDYNCGKNTYDGHKGTDISTWPYNFCKMDNNLVEVVAAAPGTIIDKHDGEFDKNCVANNLTANYVIIQHTDGSRTMYWHMKKNSVTAKAIGQPVIAGEYLGVVGSSGSSSGPHLHFEVWSGSTVATRIDPYSGTCNNLNTISWWISQKSYKETSIMKASVHTTDIVTPPCPATEILNESSSYTIPFQGLGLSPGYAKFYIFLRNEISGLKADMSILNPDGTTFLSWKYISPADSKVLMWGFSKKIPITAGKYTFKATYNGTICSQSFNIYNSTGISTIADSNQIRVFPNPVNNILNIEGEDIANGNYKFTLRNLIGQILIDDYSQVENKSLYKILDISELPKGIYILTIDSEKNRLIKKIIKQNE